VQVLREKGIADTFPSNIILLNTGYAEKEMPLLYKSFDAFVLPTRAEGMKKRRKKRKRRKKEKKIKFCKAPAHLWVISLVLKVC
jgi:glycosyltransferase involved in cell wall biosynthesis